MRRSHIIKENTEEYKRIQGNTREYRGIQENTGEYKRIQENAEEYTGECKRITMRNAGKHREYGRINRKS